jgi:hypothetical protein
MGLQAAAWPTARLDDRVIANIKTRLFTPIRWRSFFEALVAGNRRSE